MKAKLCALLLACSVSQASADIIDVTFTGLANGSRSFVPIPGTASYDPGRFYDRPYTAEFIFDTDKATIQAVSPGSYGFCVTCYQLTGGLVSATIDLGDLGIWGGDSHWGPWGGPSFLVLQDGVVVIANAGDDYVQLDVETFPSGGRYGGFQFGPCPTVVGGPCGYITSETMSVTITPAHAPSPIVGGGLPGLFLVGGLLVWWRRKWSDQ